MPPELYADIVKNGIWLAGGGALIKGLDRRLSEKTGLPFHIAEDPLLRAIARGTEHRAEEHQPLLVPDEIVAACGTVGAARGAMPAGKAPCGAPPERNSRGAVCRMRFRRVGTPGMYKLLEFIRSTSRRVPLRGDRSHCCELLRPLRPTTRRPACWRVRTALRAE